MMSKNEVKVLKYIFMLFGVFLLIGAAGISYREKLKVDAIVALRNKTPELKRIIKKEFDIFIKLDKWGSYKVKDKTCYDIQSANGYPLCTVCNKEQWCRKQAANPFNVVNGRLPKNSSCLNIHEVRGAWARFSNDKGKIDTMEIGLPFWCRYYKPVNEEVTIKYKDRHLKGKRKLKKNL